ncbi:MAG: metal ABC transporter permease [Nitrospirota bacterium]
MHELLSLGFMQRALAASVIIGALCAVIGVFVVLRGLSFIGAGTSHAAFAGVTFGYLIGVSPFAMAIIFGLGTVWIVHALYQRGIMKLDVSIGIFYTFTMALAVLFLGLMGTYNAEVYGFLFGSVLSVTRGDLTAMLWLAGGVLTLVALFYKEFHFITFDPEMAEATGIASKRLFFLLLNLIALTVVVSLKTVGALLVFAMIVIPAAAAYQMGRTMLGMMAFAVALGVGSSVGGVLISYQFDVPSGATIVLLATALFFVAAAFSPKRRRLRAARPRTTPSSA